MFKISCISLHLICANALKIHHPIEVNTDSFTTYDEICGDRNNYKCWRLEELPQQAIYLMSHKSQETGAEKAEEASETTSAQVAYETSSGGQRRRRRRRRRRRPTEGDTAGETAGGGGGAATTKATTTATTTAGGAAAGDACKGADDGPQDYNVKMLVPMRDAEQMRWKIFKSNDDGEDCEICESTSYSGERDKIQWFSQHCPISDLISKCSAADTFYLVCYSEGYGWWEDTTIHLEIKDKKKTFQKYCLHIQGFKSAESIKYPLCV